MMQSDETESLKQVSLSERLNFEAICFWGFIVVGA
jgi:hypothetical protein